MLNKLQNEWRSQFIFILLLVMLLALFVSRALLSLAMISFVIVTLFHRDFRGTLRRFIASPLLLGMAFLFMIPFISGAWSGDKSLWLDILRIKLPLLILPVAFAAFSFPRRQWKWLGLAFVLIIFLATAWSMMHYLRDFSLINESYLRAKTMRTPLENDHVRFSWLVALAIFLSGGILWHERAIRSIAWWLMLLVMVWFVLFLHILAARTGLLAFYIMVLGFVAWILSGKANPRIAIAVLSLVLALPMLAYSFLPSFRNRVKYIRYDFGFFRESNYLPGGNDATRVISIKAGWQVMNEHPLAGVGFGDIRAATREYYSREYPGMLEADKILPSSEWMIYGSGLGWPGFIGFTMVMVIPFFLRQQRPWWGLLNTMTASGFLFDIGLETQFGVFIYCVAILAAWKWMVMEKT